MTRDEHVMMMSEGLNKHPAPPHKQISVRFLEDSSYYGADEESSERESIFKKRAVNMAN